MTAARDKARTDLLERVRGLRTKEPTAPLNPLLSELHRTDWDAQTEAALNRLAELEPGEDTAIWLASLAHPLDEDMPERDNPFTGELITEIRQERAARVLWDRVWQLEDDNAKQPS